MNDGDMIDVVAGGAGNFESFVCAPPSKERLHETYGRMCCGDESKHYWVQLKNGVVALGLGSTLGEQTVLVHKLSPVPTVVEMDDDLDALPTETSTGEEDTVINTEESSSTDPKPTPEVSFYPPPTRCADYHFC
jgi:hypothetical protein